LSHKALQLLTQKGFDTALVSDGAEFASAFLSQDLDISLVALSQLGQYDPNCEHIVFLPFPLSLLNRSATNLFLCLLPLARQLAVDIALPFRQFYLS
jgi:hypothetical protein